MIIKTVDPGKHGEIVAGTLESGVFKKIVNSTKHFMRRVQGYGIQEVVFQKLKEMGCHTIVIDERDKANTLTSTIADWEDHGKVADYGSGKQRFLSTKFMKGGE